MAAATSLIVATIAGYMAYTKIGLRIVEDLEKVFPESAILV